MSASQGTGPYTEALRAFWKDALPKNFIDGEWADSEERAATVDPSTAYAYTSTPETSRDEVNRAVAAAAAAQPAWAKLTLSERAEHMRALRAALSETGEEIAFLEAIDSGNPLPSTRRDVGLALKYLADWPGQALSAVGRYSKPHPDGLSLVSQEPYGVVGKIIAYNHPMLFALAGMIYPLMAGNTIVIKTAAQTPVSTLALGRLIQGILPKGTVNIISGGREAGDALVTHPEVKRIAFTGSEATALAIQGRLPASGVVKHFSAELGGKNPFLIFDDADLSSAGEAAFAGLSFTVSAGQSCQSTAKILVHESIEKEVTALLSERMQGLRLGAAYEESTDMGPLVSEDQARRVLGFIQEGLEEGAMLEAGGAAAGQEGYYVEPTLFTGVDPTMKIAQEEIFGPVALIMPFKDEEEAIRLANDTRYGLSASIWTKDLDRAFRVSSAVQAGYIWVNDANRHYPGAPFGGAKGSGVGREESLEELASFTEPKSVNIKVAPR